MLGKTNVFLIGPMGSGKTAVGRYLARLLDLTLHERLKSSVAGSPGLALRHQVNGDETLETS